MKKFNLKRKLSELLNKYRIFEISLVTLVSKSFIFTWLLYDSIFSIKLYRKQKFFPDHFLRMLRFLISVFWFFGKIAPSIAGLTLMADGIFSIIRYSSNKVNKSGIENIPRLIRIFIGLTILTPLL